VKFAIDRYVVGTLVGGILGAGMPGYSSAADVETPSAPAVPAGPSLANVLTSAGITVNGYVAASYYHSSGYNTFHEFDVKHDTFQLDQAGVQIGYQPKEGFGAFADLITGEDARILNEAENGTDGTFNVRQAYAQYATGPLTVIGGKFTTLAGVEYSNPTSNTNFSRSLLFFAEPLTHTGLRATWAATSTLNLIAGVNNGWNTTSTSYGSKTAELAAAGAQPTGVFWKGTGLRCGALVCRFCWNIQPDGCSLICAQLRLGEATAKNGSRS
jgi:Putative beta-barrel porin-2, OmpL-like. bbp2